MDDDLLTIDDVIMVCSCAKLEDETLSFDSYGSDQPRYSTSMFLEKHGLLWKDAEEIINNLKKEELVSGPIDNYIKDRNRKLWIFIKSYKELKLYIKLLIYNKRRCVAVVSLHD